MGERVRVESVEALTKFRAAFCKFAETVRVALDEAEAEIQRTSFWLEQEQHNHWKRQVDQRTELRTRAKSALNQKKMQRTALGGKYSYIDEEKALAAAERRLEEAKQKLASVRRWSRLLDEESFSCRAATQGMTQALEVDVPNALAQLDNMVAAIEAYASSTAPSEQRSMVPPAALEDISRPEEFASVARAAPAQPHGVAEACQKLRAQTPSQAIRDGTPITKPELDWMKADESGSAVREMLADLNLARVPIAADEKVVVARGACQHGRTYLERARSPATGDSGWYFGFADDTEVTGYDAVRIGDFLAGCPGLEAALELPVGCLIVFNGPSVEALFDAQDELLWSAARHDGDD